MHDSGTHGHTDAWTALQQRQEKLNRAKTRGRHASDSAEPRVWGMVPRAAFERERPFGAWPFLKVNPRTHSPCSSDPKGHLLQPPGPASTQSRKGPAQNVLAPFFTRYLHTGGLSSVSLWQAGFQRGRLLAPVPVAPCTVPGPRPRSVTARWSSAFLPWPLCL